MTTATTVPLARPLLVAAALTLALPLVLQARAQDVTVWSSPRGESPVMVTRSDRLVLGLTTNTESERADTLGVRIQSVETDSPADKAGLKTGDRIQSANGVSLRAERFDAGERDYDGVISRRLQRVMADVKDGESVDLRVVTDGRTRSVKVTPVKSSELYGSRGSYAWTQANDRAMIGFTIGSTASARDTLGVFISAVTPDGPAEKAGIIEGDRVAAINGVSVRVASADAEDPAVGSAKASRLRTEIGKLKAGDVAELTIVSAGRTRTVRVTTVKASDMPRSAMGFAPELDGMLRRLEVERRLPARAAPTPPNPPAAPLAPSVRVLRSRIITI